MIINAMSSGNTEGILISSCLSVHLREGELRNINRSNLPRLSTIRSAHITSDARSFAHSLAIIWVSHIQSDRRIDPRMRRHGSTIRLRALDSTTPA